MTHEAGTQRRDLLQQRFGEPSSPGFNLRWKCSKCGGHKGPMKGDPLGQRSCCGVPMIAYRRKTVRASRTPQ